MWMATHSSILAWRIPGMVEPGGLPSVGSHRVGHDWRDLAAMCLGSFELSFMNPLLASFKTKTFRLPDSLSQWVLLFKIYMSSLTDTVLILPDTFKFWKTYVIIYIYVYKHTPYTSPVEEKLLSCVPYLCPQSVHFEVLPQKLKWTLSSVLFPFSGDVTIILLEAEVRSLGIISDSTCSLS